MKILLIHQAFNSADGAGGTRHFEFAKYCVKQKHQFVVIASDVSYLDAAKHDKSRKRETIDGIEIVRAKTPAFIHRGYFWRSVAYVYYMLSSFFLAIRESKIDIVMGTSPSLFQAFSASWVAFFRRRPFLLEVRDLWPEFAIEMGILKSNLLIWLARRVESFIYWRAKHILVNSPAYVDYLVNRGIPSEKVSLIPNGVDPEMFDRNDSGEEIRREFHLDGKFVITYAGAMGPANDIPTIIRAAERLQHEPQIHFLLIGGGKALGEIERLIGELQLKNVTLGGTKPKSMMSQVLAASDVCVATLMNIPMFKTTYPNKIFDYMAAGKPTVLGIDGVIRDVIEKSNSGRFVEPGDDRQLADAVSWMFANQAEAAAMGKSGKAYVTANFNREIHSQHFLELALSLC